MIVKKWYLGKTKEDHYGSVESVYLTDFSWDCEWYWGGGYLGNKNFHTHFNSCFLKAPDSRGHSLGRFYDPWTPEEDWLTDKDFSTMRNGYALWEPLSFFLNDAQYTEQEWWRIKDLFIQFYALRKTAEVFRHGGHCTSLGRSEKEINPNMASKINEHIEKVIIPEIRKALDKITEED